MTITNCPTCKSPKIRYILDFKHVLLDKITETLWVCDNCYYRFKAKYEFKLKRGPTILTKNEMNTNVEI